MTAIVVLGAVIVGTAGIVVLRSSRDDTSPSATRSDTPGPRAQTPVPAPPEPSSATTREGALLAIRAGFGANTTGGAGGDTIHVTTDADDGAGSLRAATAGSEPGWIVFDGDYTIRSSKAILVGSNKTIDGRGRRVVLTAPGADGFVLDGSRNVIIENLVLRDFGDVSKSKANDPFDAIRLDNGASDVWIDHVDLSRAGDKLIAVDGGAHAITVSWSHFHDQEQVFQIGNQTNRVADAGQTVTIHHNFFDQTGYRNPVISYGKAHVYNNLVAGWKTYGIRSERAAQLYSEGNIFQAASNVKAMLVAPGGDGCNDKGTRCDASPGFLKSVGDLALNGARIQTNEPEKVFDPHKSYAYEAEPADDTLERSIKAEAGWRPA